VLLAERRRRGPPLGSRALSCFCQAVLELLWLCDRSTADALARDHGISRPTAYRYLDERDLSDSQADSAGSIPVTRSTA
jgi:hypothetical protein